MSTSSWWFRIVKPLVPGGRSAYLEARALAHQGVAAQRRACLFAAGDSAKRMVALTFDDGPNPDVTPGVLEQLRAAECPATFFLIGREALSSLDLVRAVIADGHELGNHTMNHVRCSEESEREMTRQIQDAQDAIRFSANREALWFRPPYGDFDEAQLHLPARAGLATVFWTTKIREGKSDDANSIVRQVSAGLCPGAVIALHEKSPVIIEALKRILPLLRERNLTPVTLSTLFARVQPAMRPAA